MHRRSIRARPISRRTAAQLRALVDDLQRELKRSAEGGGEKAREKHTERGKLLPRERIRALLDPGSPFLELSPLAAHGMYDDAAPARRHRSPASAASTAAKSLVVANDATVKGGTYFPITVKKHLRAQEIALENRLPCIYLVDSGGAFLPLQDEVFPDKRSLRPHLLQPGADERARTSRRSRWSWARAPPAAPTCRR